MNVTGCLIAAVVLLCTAAAGQQTACPISCDEVSSLKQSLIDLTKHVMMLQSYTEERARTEGNSGVKIVRGELRGYKNYQTATHLKPGAFSIHDHSDFDRTLGIGELSVVLNGVEFRTRHNDYKLLMPSTTSNGYNAYEEIPFPEVPPEVLQKPTLDEQIAEMKVWFKAFNTQNKNIRDYTKYFKPVLCYLEGAWTLDKELDEPFPSDRHHLTSKTWQELQSKNRFFSLSGAKDRLENVAFLPTTIMSVNDTGIPEYAQWNYRILCSPIKREIPFSFFHQETDLTYMVAKKQNARDVTTGRAARYQLRDPRKGHREDYQLLDEIFAEIPGKDNYRANLSFTVEAEDLFDNAKPDQIYSVLNTGFYHRSYKTREKGAFGTEYAAFGFNDDQLWVAQTTQPRVAPFVAPVCILNARKDTECTLDSEIRVSYAIPLEVVYMTPLLSWNPYNLAYHRDKTASKNDRRGKVESDAFNGTDKEHYYRIPFEFFSGGPEGTTPADTVEAFVYILDPKGQVKKVSASGTSIKLPNIEGVGSVRLRYPIAPVYGEGSSVWKELNALKDQVMGDGPLNQVSFSTKLSLAVKHTHDFSISEGRFYSLIDGEDIIVTTSETEGHVHEMTVHYDPDTKQFTYIKCDQQDICPDGHSPSLKLNTKISLERPKNQYI